MDDNIAQRKKKKIARCVFAELCLQSLPSRQEVRRCDYGSGSRAITI